MWYKGIQRLPNLVDVLAAPSYCTEVQEGMRRGGEEKRQSRDLLILQTAVGVAPKSHASICTMRLILEAPYLGD